MTNKGLNDFFITSLLLILSYCIQINSFLNMDVAWHVEGARRLLAGGHYLTNIFDDNSPVVFIFYIPVVWLHILTHAKYYLIIPLYVFLWSSLSLALSYQLIKKIAMNYPLPQKFLYYVNVFIILFLPGSSNFGHREVILITLLLPYFYISIFSDNLKIKPAMAFFCAILASFGIMQNIIYLSVILIIDFYKLIFRKVQIFQLYFHLSLICQALIVFLLFPEYLKIIFPMVLCYESFFNSTVNNLITMSVLVILIPELLVLTYFRKLYQEKYIVLTAIAALCTVAIYFFERKIWFYHLYPAVAFSLILAAFLLVQYYLGIFYNRIKKTWANLVAIFLLLLTLCITLGHVIYFSIDDLILFHSKANNFNKWIEYSNRHFRGKKIYYFIVYNPLGYVLPIYTDTVVVSPWFNPWFIPYLVQTNENSLPAYCNVKRDMAITYQIFIKSLIDSKPDFVIISLPSYNQQSLILRLPFAKVFAYNSIIKLLRDNHYYFYDIFAGLLIYKKA